MELINRYIVTRWQKLFFTFTVCLVAGFANAGNQPFGFTTICSAGETCSITRPTMVAFGTDSLFVFKIMQGTFVCDVNAFNLDPRPGNPQKTCSVPSARSNVPVSSETLAEQSKTVLPGGLADGRYVIVSKFSGRVLAVKDASQENGAEIVQAEYSGSANQRWLVKRLTDGYYSIRAIHSLKSLDVVGWGQQDGTPIQQLNWLNSWNQNWNLQALGEGYFSIISRFSGKSLDVFELSREDGAEIRIWTYWGGDNQQWQFIPAELLDSGEVSLPEPNRNQLSF